MRGRARAGHGPSSQWGATCAQQFRLALLALLAVFGAQLLERYGDLVTDIEFSIAVRTEQDRAPLRDLAALVQSADDTKARAAIAGA